jgi:hypothetical protein
MAMIRKRVLCPEQLRQVPPQFSWIDHRLVRDRHIAGKSVEALALYLFLVTVADGQGLSYYSDAGIGKLLPLDAPALDRARQELVRARLIAYDKPLYQVLSLDKFVTANLAGGGPGPVMARCPATSAPRLGAPQTLGQIIREMERLT